MSILRKLVPEKRTTSLAQDLLRQRQFGGTTWAGVQITDDQALRLETVWACVQLKANQLSTLPLDGYRKTPDGISTLVMPKPSLLAAPSVIVDPLTWIYQASVSLDLRGNVYGLVFERDQRGWPTQIELFHPDLVSVSLRGHPGFPTYYFVGQEVPIEDVFHVAENVVPGSPIGLSPIEYGREAIGAAVGAEKFGAQVFGDGGHPTAVLASPNPIDKDQAEIIRDRWETATAGSRGVAVLGAGMTYAPVQITPEDSQFLMTLEHSVPRIASMFHVPAEFVGGSTGDSMTYSNVESRWLNLLATALAPRMRRIEAALTRMLPRPIEARFDEHALLRTDIKTQHDIITGDIRGGILNPDEGRGKLNLPPIPDGKGADFLWPPYAVKPDVQTGDTNVPPEPGVPDAPGQVPA